MIRVILLVEVSLVMMNDKVILYISCSACALLSTMVIKLKHRDLKGFEKKILNHVIYQIIVFVRN